MTKLEAALATVPYERTDAEDRTIEEATRSYAALLKLAPEIGALVEVLERKSLLDKGTAAHLAHPTLKAIHNNLTKWGE